MGKLVNLRHEFLAEVLNFDCALESPGELLKKILGAK